MLTYDFRRLYFMNRIAKELVRIAKQLIADSDYIYDPEHKKKPAGGYHKTEKGWSKLEQKEEDKPVKPVNKGLSDQQKQRIDSLGRSKKWKLSYSKEATPEMLDYLSNDKDWVVRRNVAQNPNTSTETLDRLSKDVWRVKMNVANNKNTSSKTLDRMSNDENREVRIGVAFNPNTSTETLDRLSKEESEYVRMNVAYNKNTSTEALDRLSEDENEYVRKNVAQNPNTSTETLDKLSKDKNEYVRENAKSNLSKKQNGGIDFSKMTPELRQKIKDWDTEDIKKFLNWLRENGKGMMPTEEQI